MWTAPTWTTREAADSYIPLPPLLPSPCCRGLKGISHSATLDSETSLRKRLRHSWMSPCQRWQLCPSSCSGQGSGLSLTSPFLSHPLPICQQNLLALHPKYIHRLTASPTSPANPGHGLTIPLPGPYSPFSLVPWLPPSPNPHSLISSQRPQGACEHLLRSGPSSTKNPLITSVKETSHAHQT